jgi:hypothetical protein
MDISGKHGNNNSSSCPRGCEGGKSPEFRLLLSAERISNSSSKRNSNQKHRSELEGQ